MNFILTNLSKKPKTCYMTKTLPSKKKNTLLRKKAKLNKKIKRKEKFPFYTLLGYFLLL
jgi:hypothetical protein